MTKTIMHETFDSTGLPSHLSWRCPPQNWCISDSALVVSPDAETDFWQRTHYGFQVDNGHFLYTEPVGDFELSTSVRFAPVHQYDQAGLMVRLSADCWLKTSVEYEPDEPNRLGAVVTNHGYSDWSTQDMEDTVCAVSLRVRREGGAYIVDYSLDAEPGEDTHWTQIRLATLLEDKGSSPVQAGLYACSPKGAGFTAWFEYLKLER